MQHIQHNSYPERLLDEMQWEFTDQVIYGDLSEFELAVRDYFEEVADYAPEILPEDWKPAEIVLYSSSVLIRYCDFDDADSAWHLAEIHSDNGECFSAAELFFKFHNAVVLRLNDCGHPFFEGLVFDGLSEAGIPVYQLDLGS